MTFDGLERPVLRGVVGIAPGYSWTTTRLFVLVVRMAIAAQQARPDEGVEGKGCVLGKWVRCMPESIAQEFGLMRGSDRQVVGFPSGRGLIPTDADRLTLLAGGTVGLVNDR